MSRLTPCILLAILWVLWTNFHVARAQWFCDSWKRNPWPSPPDSFELQAEVEVKRRYPNDPVPLLETMTLRELFNSNRRLVRVNSSLHDKTMLYDWTAKSVSILHHPFDCETYPKDFYEMLSDQFYHGSDMAIDLLVLYNFVWRILSSDFPDCRSQVKLECWLDHCFHTYRNEFEISFFGEKLNVTSSWKEYNEKPLQGNITRRPQPVSLNITRLIKINDSKFATHEIGIVFTNITPDALDDKDIALHPTRHCEGDPLGDLPALPHSFTYDVIKSETGSPISHYNVMYNYQKRIQRIQYFGEKDVLFSFKIYDYRSHLIFDIHDGNCDVTNLNERFVEGVAMKRNVPTFPDPLDHFSMEHGEVNFNGDYYMNETYFKSYSRKTFMKLNNPESYLVWYFKKNQSSTPESNFPWRIFRVKDNHQDGMKHTQLEIDFHPETIPEGTFDLSLCSSRIKSKSFTVLFDLPFTVTFDKDVFKGAFRDFLELSLSIATTRIGDINVLLDKAPSGQFRVDFKIMDNKMMNVKERNLAYLFGADLKKIKDSIEIMLKRESFKMPCSFEGRQVWLQGRLQ